MKFSFITNGVITCCLAVFGLLGNLAFLLQLYGKSNYFSRRLANHLCVLAIWDMALLLCCLCSYGWPFCTVFPQLSYCTLSDTCD